MIAALAIAGLYLALGLSLAVVAWADQIQLAYRRWWYAITGRMPRTKSPEPDRPLSDEDRAWFIDFLIDWRTFADEPDYGRRP